MTTIGTQGTHGTHGTKGMRLLIAYDGSRPAEAAVDRVLERPWPPGTSVRLVMVIEWPLLMLPADGLELADPLTDQVREVQRRDAHERLDRARARMAARADLAVDWEIREGSAKHALLDAIDEWKADLVLVGTHGKTAMSRFLLGSVSHALATHAPCSVELVKPPAAS